MVEVKVLLSLSFFYDRTIFFFFRLSISYVNIYFLLHFIFFPFRFFMDLEVEPRDLSIILTKNPFIFNEQVANLKKRVEYLKVKRFEEDEIRNIISRNPYWLSFR